MKKLPNHTALKEWASAIGALGRGEQVVLIRKGGIADPKFGLEADRFYLFPTNFHEGGTAPSKVPISHWCEVVRTWELHDLEALLRLEPLVVFDRQTLETRYRFRPDQAIHVIAVRTFALSRPSWVPLTEAYAGCRSWISLDEEIDIEGSRPVLSDAVLQSKIDEVGSRLSWESLASS
ncbi:MAG TPA: DUF1802 family protein [Thermoanaerobaculia bacterium]|nr:DUF1802 family protein [Thermoanaerobaculia bacterium]